MRVSSNSTKGGTMGRNTQILVEIVTLLSPPDKATAQSALEHHFDHQLIIDAGNIDTIQTAAKQLRLRVACCRSAPP